jgi:hypothetical protein
MSQLNLTSSGVEAFAEAFEKLLIELLALNLDASNEEIVASAVRLMAGFEGISHEPLTEMRNNPDFQNYARLFQASLEKKDTDEDSEAASV